MIRERLSLLELANKYIQARDRMQTPNMNTRKRQYNNYFVYYMQRLYPDIIIEYKRPSI